MVSFGVSIYKKDVCGTCEKWSVWHKEVKHKINHHVLEAARNEEHSAVLSAATWSWCFNWSLALPLLKHRREMMCSRSLNLMIRNILRRWEAGAYNFSFLWSTGKEIPVRKVVKNKSVKLISVRLMELKYRMMGSSITKALEIREVYGFNEVKSGLGVYHPFQGEYTTCCLELAVGVWAELL